MEIGLVPDWWHQHILVKHKRTFAGQIGSHTGSQSRMHGVFHFSQPVVLGYLSFTAIRRSIHAWSSTWDMDKLPTIAFPHYASHWSTPLTTGLLMQCICSTVITSCTVYIQWRQAQSYTLTHTDFQGIKSSGVTKATVRGVFTLMDKHIQYKSEGSCLKLSILVLKTRMCCCCLHCPAA